MKTLFIISLIILSLFSIETLGYNQKPEKLKGKVSLTKLEPNKKKLKEIKKSYQLDSFFLFLLISFYCISEFETNHTVSVGDIE